MLERRSTAEIAFLTRTSILEGLSAPLCDAVVDGRESTSLLRQLSASTLLVDEYGGSYRYHTLLRDFLQRELALREPDQVTTLHRRAADWYRANDAIEPAVDHAFAAGDLDLAATLVGNGFLAYHWSGRRATILAWALRFGVDALETRPWLAVLAAWEEVAAGDVGAAVRFANIAERGTSEGRPPEGNPSFEAGRAMLRAGMVRKGADDALANATRAVELEADSDSWRDFALWQLAIARLTMGDRAGADATFADAIVAARSAGHVAIAYCLLGHRALVAVEQGAWDAAAALIEESDAITPTPRVDGYLSSVPSRVARIRMAINRGDIAGARRELIRATSLRPLLTAAAPAAAVECLLAFARAHLAVDDPAGARALVGQASDVIRQRPDLGVLPAEVDALRATLAALAPNRGGGATSLTVAELRVLALLPYYLSFKEIGQRLGVKETTIKSQALAIYGKLGAATRSDAVDLAVDAGLLERFWPAAALAPGRSPSRGLTRGDSGAQSGGVNPRGAGRLGQPRGSPGTGPRERVKRQKSRWPRSTGGRNRGRSTAAARGGRRRLGGQGRQLVIRHVGPEQLLRPPAIAPEHCDQCRDCEQCNAIEGDRNSLRFAVPEVVGHQPGREGQERDDQEQQQVQPKKEPVAMLHVAGGSDVAIDRRQLVQSLMTWAR